MQNRIHGLQTVIYKGTSLADAKAWYAQVFETQPYFDEPFYTGFNISGYELGLHPEDPNTAKGQNGVMYCGVPAGELEFERLRSLGTTVHENPTNVGGAIIVAAVNDPWGNTIDLIYNPEFALP